MDKKIITQDEFLTRWSQKARFTKQDIHVILQALIEVFEEIVREEATLKIKYFGRLYSQIIPARLGKDKQELPETTRIIFRLAENIRNANK